MRLLLLMLLVLACCAAASSSSVDLATQRWTREAGAAKVVSEVALSSGMHVLGKHVLFVDLESAADSAGTAAALLNGSLLLALPPGLEPDGKPRLYWHDAERGWQYAYSTSARAVGKSGPIPGQPLAALRQLGEEALALDPQVVVITPEDPRITDKALPLHWRLPADILARPLVDPFQPGRGIGAATRLRAVFPLKGAGELPLAIYFGALSCAGRAAGEPVADGAAPAPELNCEWLAWEGEVMPGDLGLAARIDVGATSASPALDEPAQVSGESRLAPAQESSVTGTGATEVKSADMDPTPTAKEVAPGTLALEPEVYRVPLRPITGAGHGPTSGANLAVVPAAPSQLSPQAGAHLAAPASEMVLVLAGPFEMGSAVGPLDDSADEAPQHSVELPAYYIDKLPVTNRQFYNFVISSGYKPEGNWQKYYEPATADLPVRAVSWNDASAYAKWAGKRLPTEAEWEKAARGTDARTYPWGEEWSSEILPRGENYYRLVGSPAIASPYGVLATCGILWQWTASSYAAYPFNPKAGGDKKVLRGGCFSNGRNIVRCANRYAEPPGVALNTFTFRCAKDAE